MIHKLDNTLEKISQWILVCSVMLMLSLSILNIVFRWFEISIHWIDPLVRHLVFFTTFIGASLAVKLDEHIKIDVLSRILEAKKLYRLKFLLSKAINLIALLACFVLIYASYDLAKLELEVDNISFLGIQTGYLIGIITFGTVLISMRLALKIFMPDSQRE